MNGSETASTTLDKLALRSHATITAVDWSTMSNAEAKRLRALGLDEGVAVEKLHRGIFWFRDPVAIKVGRMKIAVRKSHAEAISVTLKS